MSRSRGSLHKLKRSTRFRTRQNFCLLFFIINTTIHSNNDIAVRMGKLFILLSFPAFHCWTTVSGQNMQILDAVFIHGESFPGFWILQARISQILESGYPYIGRSTSQTFLDLFTHIHRAVGNLLFF